MSTPGERFVDLISAWGKPAVGIIVLVIYGGMHALAFLKLLPSETLQSLLGSDGTLATAVVLYYFGSSASSQRKDDTIATQSTQLAQSSPAPPADSQGATKP